MHDALCRITPFACAALLTRYEARIMQAKQRDRESGGFMAIFFDHLLARQAAARRD